MKIFLLILLFITSANSGLPPTTSKISGDTTNKTTFNYQFPNFTGTHTGTTVSLGVNSVAGGGTGANSFTAGSLIFSNGTSLAQDNASLFFDNTLNRLGIGTTSPTAPIDVHSSTSPMIQATHIGAQSTIAGGAVQVLHDSGAAMGANNRLGALQFTGAKDASSTYYNGSIIAGFATEAWSGTAGGSKLVFSTTPNTTQTKAVALTLDQNQSATFANTVNATTFVGSLTGNASTVTTNANLTGAVTSTGNATLLGSFSSSNLLTALTDETGTGLAVFSTSPTLVTPALGTPSALVATNATGTASGLTSGKATNIVGGLGGSVPYQSAVDTTVLLANGSSGQVLTSAGGTSAPSWATPAIKNSFNAVENLSFATSVGSNALTIAAKDSAGSNPSSTTTAISFRSSTLTSGAYVSRTITSALSIVISSGSTLGHTSAVAKNIWLYAIDNAGTVELAVSSNIFDESYLYSTTAEGGAGAADSESVLYSTTARSNVAIRLIGRLLSTQTTAGTWAAVPTDVSMHGFKPVSVYASYRTAAGQSIANASMPIVDFGGVIYDPYNAVTTGGSWKFTAPIAGLYLVENCLRWGNSLVWTLGSYVGTNLYKNGSLFVANDTAIQVAATFATGPTVCISEEVRLLPTEYIDIRASHGESTARALLASSSYNRITVLRVGEY